MCSPKPMNWRAPPTSAAPSRKSKGQFKKNPALASDAFHHAHVALDIAGAQRLERLFIGGRVVAREGLVQTVELDQHHSLVHAGLVGFRRLVANEKAAAGCR